MSKEAYSPWEVKNLVPLHDNVIIYDMNFEQRLSKSGIVLPSDDMKDSGIRPRWGKVYAVGPEQTEIKVGQYILVSHGRWTRGIKISDITGEKTIRKVDNNDILLVSDDPVFDEIMGDKVF